MPNICAIGTAAADIKARMTHRGIDTTDVPGRITLMPGGVSRNIAENLARLDTDVTFIGVFGDDMQARAVIEHSQKAGIDIHSIVRVDHTTASLAVTIDAEGNQITGVFSGAILDTLAPHDLYPFDNLIRSADALISDGGVPQTTLGYLAEIARSDTLFYCNPASVALAPRLISIYPRCDLITCNHVEAEALTGNSIQTRQQAIHAARKLVETGVKCVVITLGAQGIVFADESRHEIRDARPTRLVDATGAGDALAAATIFALLRDDPIDEALSLGLEAAALTCKSEDSVSSAMSMRALQIR